MTKNNMPAIDNFLAWISSIEGKKLLFRGHADSTWKVAASGYRRLEKDAPLATFHNSIKRLIDEARLQGLDKKDGMKMPDLELLAELQHYGAATCLIDFTENPLIALWFACHEHQDKDGTVVAIASDDSKKFSEVADEKTKSKEITKFLQQKKIWKWTPSNVQNNRILAQSSIFLFGPSRISAKLYKNKKIKNSDKKNIIAYLRDKFSITEQRLFSDFAGFAMANAHNKEYTEYSANDYFSLGLTYLQRGMYKKAIEYYDQVIEISHQDADAFHIRGLAKAGLGNHKDAIKDFDKAIEINPQDAEAYFNRGFAKAGLGNHKDAIKDFDKAIEINPQDTEAFNNRGVAKAKSGNHKDAIKDYNKAIAINPQFAEAYFNRGLAKAKSGNHKDATKDYNKAIEINPQDVDTYINRGLTKAKSGNHKDAIKDYNKAIEINPQDADTYYNRGNAKAKLGSHKEAIQDYDQVIAINLQYANAYYNRGLAKQDIGDQAGAKKDFAMSAKLTKSQNGNNNPPSTPAE